MSVKCFEDEKHYIVELLTDAWMLLLLLPKLLENMLGTHPQRHIMRKGHLGQQFIQKGVNQTEILELHCCIFLMQSPKVIRVMRPDFFL